MLKWQSMWKMSIWDLSTGGAGIRTRDHHPHAKHMLYSWVMFPHQLKWREGARPFNNSKAKVSCKVRSTTTDGCMTQDLLKEQESRFVWVVGWGMILSLAKSISISWHIKRLQGDCLQTEALLIKLEAPSGMGESLTGWHGLLHPDENICDSEGKPNRAGPANARSTWVFPSQC